MLASAVQQCQSAIWTHISFLLSLPPTSHATLLGHHRTLSPQQILKTTRRKELTNMTCTASKIWWRLAFFFFFFWVIYWKRRVNNGSFFFSFIFISWRLITLQYCSGFCYTLTWISHGFTCIPHPDPPSALPLYQVHSYILHEISTHLNSVRLVVFV